VPIVLLLLYAFSRETRNPPATRSFTPQPLTACAIVTRADVEEALGRRVSAGNEETDGRTSTCDYAAKGGLVSFTIQRLTVRPDIQAEIAALMKEIREGVVRDAPGFTDAFYFDLPGAGTQLHIVNGSSAHLMISILGFGDATQVSVAAARIGRQAAKRL
jgi:hypothetical protein